MAHGTLINGTAYEITGGKCLVGGVEYSIQRGRTLVGGTGYDIAFGTPLSDYAEGDIVYINENGVPIEFYVAKHNYESTLNGDGRVLMVRKSGHSLGMWNTTNVNEWGNSSLLSWLNGTYKSLLDTNLRSMISTTKYKYTPGNGKWIVRTRSDPVFLLSLQELGKSSDYANVEGSTLPISQVLINDFTDGGSAGQWVRTPDTESEKYAFFVSTPSSDFIFPDRCTATRWVRPVFTLPSNAVVIDGAIL